MIRKAFFDTLLRRLREPRRFVQVVAGPRQVGKTTLVRQVLEALGAPFVYASADAPTLEDTPWIEAHWEHARRLARAAGPGGAVLALDEVQKIPRWSDSVKRLWDEDAMAGVPLHVVLLGSAPLLVQRGLTESLAGRFEQIRMTHWSFAEMREAFGWDVARYVYFGGYPGAAILADDEERWRRFVLDALIETSIGRDILLLSRVDKPSLLRRLFFLACDHSAQILSFQKMVGQLQDAGNTTTLAHYLDLLEGAGLIAGLDKVAGSKVRQRGSSPKLLALNTALVSAVAQRAFAVVRADGAAWGRLVETAVGAHLVAGLANAGGEVRWWRERNVEVDYVVSRGERQVALEVKSGRPREAQTGLKAFCVMQPATKPLVVGTGGVPLEEFLATPVVDLLGA